MDLYPLPAGQAVRVATLTSDVDAGWMRRIRHGPMTIGEVLERARDEMSAQDERERQAADPLVSMAMKHTYRRSLWNRLLGRT